jgi:transposase
MPTVIIACDPNKASVTCAVLPSTREVVETATFGADQRGWNELCRFIERWPDRRFAVEGAHGTGRSLAQRLVAIDEKVVDVPAKLAARVRVLSAGHGKKNDVSDAVAVGVAAMDHPRLQSVAPAHAWR